MVATGSFLWLFAAAAQKNRQIIRRDRSCQTRLIEDDFLNI